jgi:hypothetical protein
MHIHIKAVASETCFTVLIAMSGECTIFLTILRTGSGHGHGTTTDLLLRIMEASSVSVYITVTRCAERMLGLAISRTMLQGRTPSKGPVTTVEL